MSEPALLRLIQEVARGEPQSHEMALPAEQSLLGGLLLDNTAFDRVSDLVTAEDFYCDEHRRVWRHIADLIKAGQPADVVTVWASIEATEDKDKTGGAAYLGALAQNTPSALNVHRYAELVREHAVRRQMAALGADLQARAERGDITELRHEMRARLDLLASPLDGWPTPLDLAELAAQEPIPPRHIVEPWVPAGEVTLFGAHGGAGKGLIVKHLGCCVALGVPWHGIATERRRVLYISAEDPVAVLHWRLTRIAAHLGVHLADLAGWLQVIDASHIEAELMIDPGRGEEPILTTFYDVIRRQMAGSQVLILDGVSDLFGCNEIIRRHVRRFVRAIRRLVPPDGAAILLAHVDKAAARDKSTTDRYSGSTAWHNSVRARWSLDAAPAGQTLTLSLAKANHGKAGAEIRLRWDPAAHMYIATAMPTTDGIVGSIRERQERDMLVQIIAEADAAGDAIPAATMGRRTAWHAITARQSCPEALRTAEGRSRCWRLLEELRAERRVFAEVRRGANRHHREVLRAR